MSRCAILFLSILAFGCSADIGIRNGKMAHCPILPNCVSSQSSDQWHFIEPAGYKGALQQERERLIAVLQGMKRARIVTAKDNYVYAEFTSPLFRFVDDVEFYFDEDAKMLHMRSASRLGFSDLGANRKRLEQIKALLAAAAEKSAQ